MMKMFQILWLCLKILEHYSNLSIKWNFIISKFLTQQNTYSMCCMAYTMLVANLSDQAFESSFNIFTSLSWHVEPLLYPELLAHTGSIQPSACIMLYTMNEFVIYLQSNG